MAQNMDKQFDYIYNNPNKDKIKMGLALNKSIGITKELIIASMFEDKDKTIYQSSNFFEKVYSKDVKKVKKLKVAKKLKEKLWNFKLWRKFTQSKVWKFFRKIVRRG